MALSLSMHLQQTQTLLMTPQLKQALAVLQMPTPVLCAYLDQQLQANPALEVVEESLSETEGDLDHEAEAPSLLEVSEWLEEDGPFPAGGRREDRRTDVPLWEAAGPALTLQEHLEEQIALSGWNAADEARVSYLAGNLGNNGYLALPLADLAGDLGVGQAEAERLLSLLQSLEPAGVGARDLRECLLLQLKARGEEGGLAWALVSDHLADVAAGRWSLLAQRLGVTPVELSRARQQLRALDPKPGRAFASGPDVRYVVPDAFVERVGADYVVVLNDSAVPNLRLSPAYRAAARADESVRRYIEERLQAGAWLLQALEQRRQTLLRVVEAVVRRQRRYLQEGAGALVPLTLKTVGLELSLHESTISRAVAGKFVQTPRGLKPLRFFFGSGVTGPGGEGISATGVKKRLEQLIHREDPRRPLSDEALCQRLQAEGIRISRRTVAKYREEMGVPPSNQRRQFT